MIMAYNRDGRKDTAGSILYSFDTTSLKNINTVVNANINLK